MKLKALLLSLATAGIVVSLAAAGPPPGTGAEKAKAGQAKAAAAKAKAAAKTKAAKAKAKKQALLAAKEEATVLDGCKPRVAFILRGDFVSASAGADGTLVAMLVKGSNHHAKRYVGKQVTVTVGERTRVIRRGPASASALAAGDRLLVHVRGCKSADESMALYAKRVVATPAAGDEDDDEDDTTTGTTTTTTTGTTTTGTTTTTP